MLDRQRVITYNSPLMGRQKKRDCFTRSMLPEGFPHAQMKNITKEKQLCLICKNRSSGIYANSTLLYSVIGKNWWEKNNSKSKKLQFKSFTEILYATLRNMLYFRNVMTLLMKFHWANVLLNFWIRKKKKRDNLTVCVDYWLTYEGPEYHRWLCSSY